MEPDVKAFLVAIAQCVSMLLLWMLLNAYFGIRKGWFFPETLKFWHIIYYVVSAAAFVWVIRYIVRKWKSVPKIEM